MFHQQTRRKGNVWLDLVAPTVFILRTTTRIANLFDYIAQLFNKFCYPQYYLIKEELWLNTYKISLLRNIYFSLTWVWIHGYLILEIKVVYNACLITLDGLLCRENVGS